MREPIEEAGSSRSNRLAPRDHDQRPADREVAGGLNGSLWTLQQAAGNTAVNELLGTLPLPSLDAPPAPAAGVVQREGSFLDDIMKEQGGGAGGGGPAGGKSASSTGLAAPGTGARAMEAGYFQGSIVAPIRTIADAARAPDPDHGVILEQITSLGPSIIAQEDRYKGRDDVTVSRLEGMRGWLGQVYNELRRRTYNVKPMTDKEIATRLVDVADDAASIGSGLK